MSDQTYIRQVEARLRLANREIEQLRAALDGFAAVIEEYSADQSRLMASRMTDREMRTVKARLSGLALFAKSLRRDN